MQTRGGSKKVAVLRPADRSQPPKLASRPATGSFSPQVEAIPCHHLGSSVDKIRDAHCFSSVGSSTQPATVVRSSSRRPGQPGWPPTSFHTCHGHGLRKRPLDCRTRRQPGTTGLCFHQRRDSQLHQEPCRESLGARHPR